MFLLKKQLLLLLLYILATVFHRFSLWSGFLLTLSHHFNASMSRIGLRNKPHKQFLHLLADTPCIERGPMEPADLLISLGTINVSIELHVSGGKKQSESSKKPNASNVSNSSRTCVTPPPSRKSIRFPHKTQRL